MENDCVKNIKRYANRYFLDTGISKVIPNKETKLGATGRKKSYISNPDQQLSMRSSQRTLVHICHLVSNLKQPDKSIMLWKVAWLILTAHDLQ